MSQEKEIIEKLDEIIALLKSQKRIMNFEAFCEYAGISKSYGYKLTSSLQVPFYRPHGKLLYFEKSEIDQWLLRNRVCNPNQLK